MNLTIRAAKKEDLDDIVNIIKKFDPYDARYARKYYREYFDSVKRKKDRVFVAVINEEIVAVSGYFRDIYEYNESYWLGWTYVHPKYQGKHIVGLRLLKKVESELRKRKAKRLFVNSSSSKMFRPAVKFYVENGFRFEGTLRDYYGKGQDQIIFGKDL